MNAESTSRPREYEKVLLHIAQSLPAYQRLQLLDYAVLLQSRLVGTFEAKPVLGNEEVDERVWGRAAVQSLAKYWDTPEEDEAWAYLQEGTS